MSTPIKASSTNQENIQVLSESCEVNDILRKISPRWKMILLYEIANGIQQFSKLKKKYPSLSDQILSKRLHELEQEAFVEKDVLRESPPKIISYRVTDKGSSLLKVMMDLHQWALHWE